MRKSAIGMVTVSFIFIAFISGGNASAREVSTATSETAPATPAPKYDLGRFHEWEQHYYAPKERIDCVLNDAHLAGNGDDLVNINVSIGTLPSSYGADPIDFLENIIVSWGKYDVYYGPEQIGRTEAYWRRFDVYDYKRELFGVGAIAAKSSAKFPGTTIVLIFFGYIIEGNETVQMIDGYGNFVDLIETIELTGACGTDNEQSELCACAEVMWRR